MNVCNKLMVSHTLRRVGEMYVPRSSKRAENVYKISGFLVDFCGFVWVDQRLSTWISEFLSSSCTRFLLCF